jgi:hypothetical protein
MRAGGLLGAFLLLLGSMSANTISQEQAAWHKKYKDQKNIIPPEKMMLNTDAEPDLTQEGFVDLYNGKNLEGWVPFSGNSTFEAKGECIEGVCVKGSPSTYLSTEKRDYKDFIFSAELKWIVDGNSGLMFRAQAKVNKNSITVFGPQVEMEGTEQGRGWSGGVFGQGCGGFFYPLWLDAHKEVRAALIKDDWNRVTVQCDGENIKTWLNGIPAANMNTSEYLEGFFSLQIHSGHQGTVQFKNIKVKELNQ